MSYLFHLPDPATVSSHVIKCIDAESGSFVERVLYRCKLTIVSHMTTGDAFMRGEGWIRYEIWGWSDLDTDRICLLTEDEKKKLDLQYGGKGGNRYG